MERILKKWSGKVDKERYLKEKKEYRKLCEMKKEKRNEELMKEARETKTQKQIWEVINREKRKKVKINRKIGFEEWDEYFRELLEGSGNKVKLELRGKGRVEVEGEEEKKRGIKKEK